MHTSLITTLVLITDHVGLASPALLVTGADPKKKGAGSLLKGAPVKAYSAFSPTSCYEK